MKRLFSLVLTNSRQGQICFAASTFAIRPTNVASKELCFICVFVFKNCLCLSTHSELVCVWLVSSVVLLPRCCR